MDINEENNIPEAKKDWTMRIVAINLVLMIIYTIAFRSMKDGYSILGVAFFIAIQVIICLLTAIFFKPRAFLLSALAVLLIGFSTCWIAYSGNL
jgi:predicted signal transduction protein with EAL and GGDEF domain